jgi:hypothetical protein
MARVDRKYAAVCNLAMRTQYARYDAGERVQVTSQQHAL